MRAQWVCSRERRIALYKRSSVTQNFSAEPSPHTFRTADIKTHTITHTNTADIKTHTITHTNTVDIKTHTITHTNTADIKTHTITHTNTVDIKTHTITHTNTADIKTHKFVIKHCALIKRTVWNIWNNLPQDIRHSATLSSFKSQLKTFLFSEYFG